MSGKNSNKNNQNDNVSNEEIVKFEEAKADLATEIADLNTSAEALAEERNEFEATVSAWNADTEADRAVKDIDVSIDLLGGVEFAIKVCERALIHDDFDGVLASGTNDLSIAYSRIQSAITRLKIARDKL